MIQRQLCLQRSAARWASLPPEGFNYELFLDENGQKISKSKGNGLTIDEWLTYALGGSSLSLYMYQKPKTAKKLYFDVIPKAVDEYFSLSLRAYQRQDLEKPPRQSCLAHAQRRIRRRYRQCRCPFAMLLNLVSASNARKQVDVLWGFISRYAPGVTAGKPSQAR